MSEMPPPGQTQQTQPGGQPAGQMGQQQPGYGYRPPGGTSFDMARLPIPGNAELVVWILALLVAAIVALALAALDVNGWMNFFLWTTVAYLLSRGVAKASRVLEH